MAAKHTHSQPPRATRISYQRGLTASEYVPLVQLYKDLSFALPQFYIGLLAYGLPSETVQPFTDSFVQKENQCGEKSFRRWQRSHKQQSQA